MVCSALRARRWLVAALLALALVSCARPGPTPQRGGDLDPTGVPIAAATLEPPTAAPTATATREPPTPLPALVEALPAADAYLAGEAAAGRFSGAVLVAKQGRILLKKGYGLADREQDLPNTAQTRFHIGSLTKQFTALAILQLQERGKLRVTDSIEKYVPDCPPAWRDITIEHLLSHTAGLVDYFNLQALDPLLTQRVTPSQIVDLFREQPLMFEPGARFYYSNSGYVLLGRIIEQAAGESYGQWLEEHILAPLRMAETTYGSSGPAGACAVGYVGHWLRALNADLSVAYAAGGLCSTVDDLYRWEQALYTTQLCSQGSLEALFSPHAKVDDKAAYGYGWFIRDVSGRQRLSHTGLYFGYSAIIARFPSEHVTIILLSNLEQAPLAAHLDVLAKQVLG